MSESREKRMAFLAAKWKVMQTEYVWRNKEAFFNAIFGLPQPIMEIQFLAALKLETLYDQKAYLEAALALARLRPKPKFMYGDHSRPEIQHFEEWLEEVEDEIGLMEA